jgi:hypothetical protein
MAAYMVREEKDHDVLSQPEHTFQSEDYDHHCGAEERNSDSPTRNGGQHGTT